MKTKDRISIPKAAQVSRLITPLPAGPKPVSTTDIRLETENFLKGLSGKLTVIVNDGTRPTPTARVLTKIADLLHDWMKNANNLEFIVATGTHRKARENEIAKILGPFAGHGAKSHDSRDDANHVFLGNTEYGTPFFLDRDIVESDAILVIGSVEPHYFAGFTGGRKGFLPGTAAYSSVEINHSRALMPGAELMRLDGNPVHVDLDSALDLLPDIPLLSIQAVADDIIFAGGIRSSFIDAVNAATELYTVKFSQKADIVITHATYPLDIDLYQTHKAMEHGKLALKDGGTMIVVSSCREGIGPDNFYRLMTNNSPEQIIEKAYKNYRLGYHKPVKLLELNRKYRIILVSELSSESIAPLGFEYAETIEKACSDVCSAGHSLIILENGSTFVPQIVDN